MMHTKGKPCSYFSRENASKSNHYENKYGSLGEKTVKPDYRAKYDKRRGQDCPQAKQQEKDGHDADALF